MRLLVALTLAAVVAAGCVTNAPKEDVQAASAPGDAPLKDFVALSNATSGKGAPATLEAPPVWRGGEWWKVKVTDAFDHKSYESVRVVAGKEGDKYLVGMPRDAFSNEQMVIHLPGFGQVAQDDLSFQVHNCPFEPLKFPLKDGLSWHTKFECQDVDAVAKVKSPTTAEIEMTGTQNGIHMVLTYDATMHEVTKVVYDDYATVEVIDHGYDYSGIVTVPHMFHLVFQQSRTGPLLAGGSPSAPTDTVKVDPTYDRVSFVIILGSVAPFLQRGAPDAAAGVYDEKVTGPDGQTYELQMLPHESGLKLAYFMVSKPGGEWTFQHTVAGPGIAVAEGIAYHAYDVDLPTGRILPSTGQHQHGA